MARRAGASCACAGIAASNTRHGSTLRPSGFRTGIFVFHRNGRHEPTMLRLALPNKGRLPEDTRDLFADPGLTLETRGERARSASLGGEFEAIFVRAQDIPEFVADGAADAGVTGWDIVCES